MREGRGPAPRRAAGRALALLAMLVLDARAQKQPALVVVPPGRAVEMRVGQRRGFSAVLAEPNVQYNWSLDGGASGQGPVFEFRPTASHVGRHEISVTALAGAIAARHTWSVTVAAVPPPAIVRAAPSAAIVRVPAGEALQFELQVQPGTLTDRVTTRWTVDGAPAGEGPFLGVRVPPTGTQRVRAVATSENGGAVMREWQIVSTPAAVAAAVPPPALVPDPELAEIVRRKVAESVEPSAPAKKDRPAAAPPKPSREAAAAPPKPLPPDQAPPPAPSKKAAVKPVAQKAVPAKPVPPKPPPPVEVARAAPPESPPPPVAAVPPPPSGVSEDDVRALMFRYEQAWRTRNAAELRRIGHVETDAQESALAKYFATTNDLEVAVHVLELRVDAGRGIVRFTRRDRFRDPAGREVEKESPPIEKTIVRTPEGVRFAPRS